MNPGNDRTLPHFHPVKGSGGYGVVEHEPHAGQPDHSHVHVDDPNLAASVPDMPLPPGAAAAPIAPGHRRRHR